MIRSICSRMVRKMVSRSKLEVSERASWWKTSRSASGMRPSVSFVISCPGGSRQNNSATQAGNKNRVAAYARNLACACSLRQDLLLRSAPNVHHRPRRFQEFRFSDVMACFFPFDGTQNIAAQFLVVRPGPQSSIKIMLYLRKQARPNLAV